MSKILVIAEHLGGKLNPSTARAVSAAVAVKPEAIDVLVLADSVAALAAEAAKIDGVSRVLTQQSSPERAVFEVESLKDKFIRGDLARAVVEAGWNLNELRPAAMSLEEIFLAIVGKKEEK